MSRILASVDAGLADERDRFAERLDGRGEQEIAAELHKIGDRGLLADGEMLLAQRFEQRHTSGDRVGRARRDDEQFARRRRIGPPEYAARRRTLAGLVCAAASFSDKATLIVLIERCAASAPRPSSRRQLPTRRFRSAASSASIVMTAAAPRQASAALAAISAPCATSAAALPGVRLKTRSAWPALTEIRRHRPHPSAPAR